MRGIMSDARDPAIKLFGHTIPLTEAQQLQLLTAEVAPVAEQPLEVGDGKIAAVHSQKKPSKIVKDIEENNTPMTPNERRESLQMSCSSSLETINEDDYNTTTEGNKDTSDTKDENSTVPDGSAKERVLKKPDKILPCPRCNSMDTKFCYYNNYNINQPRHFCKNCQRYWTAGGTMRNVPVGAGRRKNKHSSSLYRHILMSSDGMQPAQISNADLSNHQPLHCASASSPRPLTSNGTVLEFGPEVPLCESMASALNIREENRDDHNSLVCRENKEEPSCVSSVTVSNCLEKGFTENAINIEQSSAHAYCDEQAHLHHFQCFPGGPWAAYPWSPDWNSIVAMASRPDNCNQNPMPWITPSAFCPPTVPFPFVPSSFWGYMPSWPNGPWTVPWAGANSVTSPSLSTSNSGNGSPKLGKHARDATFPGEEKSGKSLWIPKTLRIDDPDEAAKSSIWDTLGIKPEEGRIFKPFQSKSQSKVPRSDAAHVLHAKVPRSDAAHVLHANPAALSRSQTFQENT